MIVQASVTITSRYSGIVKKLHYEVDDIARVGKPLVDIEVTDGAEGEDDPSTQPPLEEGQPAAVPRAETSASMPSKVLATPAVRRIAAENEVSGLVRWEEWSRRACVPMLLPHVARSLFLMSLEQGRMVVCSRKMS